METGEQAADPLLDQRDALYEELVQTISLEAPFYGTLSADTQKEVAVRLVNAHLASLGEDRAAASRAWGDDPFARRHQLGAPLADVLRGLGVVRRVLCRAARALEPKELAEGVVARFESVSARTLDAVVAAHERDA